MADALAEDALTKHLIVPSGGGLQNEGSSSSSPSKQSTFHDVLIIMIPLATEKRITINFQIITSADIYNVARIWNQKFSNIAAQNEYTNGWYHRERETATMRFNKCWRARFEAANENAC
jgi:hypothetical protein